MRVLNTQGDKCLDKFPSAPTLKELGYDIVQKQLYGIVALKQMPSYVVRRLNDVFKKQWKN